MPVEYVKVQKNGVTKQIRKVDLPEYITLGWIEVNEDVTQDVKYKYLK